MYWNDLTGEKYILYVPNNGHGIQDIPRLVGGLNALHEHVANGKKLPKLDWKFSRKADGKLRLSVTSDVKADRMQVWTAKSDTARFPQLGILPEPMQANGERLRVRTAPSPPSGYAALLGEAIFNGDRIPFYLSTNVRIVGNGKAK